MSIEDLKHIEEEINGLSDESKKISSELSFLENNEIIKRYLWLKSNIGRINKEIETKEKEAKRIKSEICDHKVLYLLNFATRRKKYCPNCKCLSCGKKLIGALNKEQVVVNQDYLDYSDYVYIGNPLECNELESMYDSLKEQGTSDDEIATKIIKKLELRYGNTKLHVPIIRK